MIEENYVSFDTVKLLKEAGFDVPTRGIWRTTRTGDSGFVEYNCKQTTDDLCWNSLDGFQYEYLAPTQALAARWLREKHRIALDIAFIPPSVDGDVWQYFVGEMDDMIWKGDYEAGRRYATYEQAMEAGLQEALKLIKKRSYERDTKKTD